VIIFLVIHNALIELYIVVDGSRLAQCHKPPPSAVYIDANRQKGKEKKRRKKAINSP
jgi:hypothetical protein